MHIPQDHFLFLSAPDAVLPKIESKVKFGLYALTGLADRVLLSEDTEDRSAPRPIGFRL
jgi:hypothetical protein